MGLLANFKIRTKVLIALLPLAIMVIAAALYSSIEMKTIGTNRFKQFLETEQSTSADHFADRLLKELSGWTARGSGEDLDDDITMVALRVEGD